MLTRVLSEYRGKNKAVVAELHFGQFPPYSVKVLETHRFNSENDALVYVQKNHPKAVWEPHKQGVSQK